MTRALPRGPSGDASATAFYVINLDRSTARLAAMREKFAAQGLAFERIPGVLGTDLPEDLQPYFLCEGRPVATMTPGEIGCYAAHLNACQAFLDGAGEAAVILEDDARLADDFAATLAEALRRMPAGWDVLRLSNTPKRAYLPLVRLSNGRFVVNFSRVPILATAYAVSRAGAAKMLAPGLRTEPIDVFLRRPWLAGLHTYGIVPSPVSVEAVLSDIDSFGVRRDDRSLKRQVRRLHIREIGARLRYERRQVGLAGWLTMFGINMADAIARRLFGITLIHRAAGLFRITG